MAKAESNPYLYFLFSTEHVNKKNTVEGNIGKKYECGTVVVGGKRKKYSYLATSVNDRASFLKNYPDARLIAEGYKNKTTYTSCTTTSKRGN